jgi:hypothetical protein
MQYAGQRRVQRRLNPGLLLTLLKGAGYRLHGLLVFSYGDYAHVTKCSAKPSMVRVSCQLAFDHLTIVLNVSLRPHRNQPRALPRNDAFSNCRHLLHLTPAAKQATISDISLPQRLVVLWSI